MSYILIYKGDCKKAITVNLYIWETCKENYMQENVEGR